MSIYTGSTITWTETIPSDSSEVGHFASYARSVWTAIEQGLRSSMYWPEQDSAASIGELRPGSARAYVGSQSSSSNASARRSGLYVTSDSTRVFLYGSTGTYLVGSARHIDYLGQVEQASTSFFVVPPVIVSSATRVSTASLAWVRESLVSTCTGPSVFIATPFGLGPDYFPMSFTSAYAVAPHVMLTIESSATSMPPLIVASIQTSGVKVAMLSGLTWSGVSPSGFTAHLWVVGLRETPL